MFGRGGMSIKSRDDGGGGGGGSGATKWRGTAASVVAPRISKVQAGSGGSVNYR
jgi:hypothetical protein